MSIEIKNLVINVHVAGNDSGTNRAQLENLRSEILDECREMISESIEKSRER